MKSIGIYPGTFDPVHDGHISFAKAALKEGSLDVVYFMPEENPRSKTNVPDLDIRANTIRDSIEQSPSLEVINLMSDRFTVIRTLPEIEAQLSPASFTLLLGSDVAKNLASWPHIEDLLKNWHLAIGMRNNDRTDDIEEVLKKIEVTYRISIHRIFVYTNKSDLSSSEVRERR